MDLDFGTIVFLLAFLWYLFSAVRPKQKPPGRPLPEASGRRAAEPSSRGPELSTRYDTQVEARRLERLLQGLDAEPEPFVISLETEPPPGDRRLVDYDSGAEALVRGRIEAARARDRALSAADHEAFDRRIRRAPSVRRRAVLQRPSMRDAVVWREILGPPVSLRDE